MAVNIYNNSINGCYIGNTAITAIYQGTEKLYPTAPPQPKFQASYSDGTSYSAACDSDTTLTSFTTKPNGYDYMSMTSSTIGDCIVNIDAYAFYNCSGLTNITIPNSVTSIGGGAFQRCISLINIDLPSGVTTIGGSAFATCGGITSITIPSGVTDIGRNAFLSCSGLQNITCLPATPPVLGIYAFDSTNNAPIYVLAASVSAYQSAWSDYASRIQAIP